MRITHTEYGGINQIKLIKFAGTWYKLSIKVIFLTNFRNLTDTILKQMSLILIPPYSVWVIRMYIHIMNIQKIIKLKK